MPLGSIYSTGEKQIISTMNETNRTLDGEMYCRRKVKLGGDKRDRDGSREKVTLKNKGG